MSQHHFRERTEQEHLELGETLHRAREIEKIQNGGKVGRGIEKGGAGADYLRFSPQVETGRDSFQKQVQDAINNGTILADWISDKLRDKPNELQNIFEALTDSHDGKICDVSGDLDDEDTLLGRIASTIPGYDFRGTKVKLYISSHDRMFDVVFLDDSCNEVQRFGLADFYVNFMGHC